jgi:hypothetical protein
MSPEQQRRRLREVLTMVHGALGSTPKSLWVTSRQSIIILDPGVEPITTDATLLGVYSGSYPLEALIQETLDGYSIRPG